MGVAIFTLHSKKKMRKNLTLLIFVLISTIGFSQGGIIRTFSDYENGKIEEVGEFKIFYFAGKRFKAIFKKDGKKVKINLKKETMWGLTDGKRVFRLDPKKRPCLLIQKGGIVVFGNYSTKLTKYGYEAEKVREFPFYFATSINGEMKPITKGNIQKLFKKGSKEYKEIKKSYKGAGLFEMMQFIEEYNAGKFD